ncbi:lytic transglycosylase domain-containing protein [Aliiroseovarius crassostreae]|uniref:lytic transglycosylase domain-containing protein n=1 Tax=Aliiroseovarius crassostreae TaxID=154981 RepID=UPI00223C253E|nr:lytic transglycosylase domain-containing protein [Aliiroseovarius crassostreae]
MHPTHDIPRRGIRVTLLAVTLSVLPLSFHGGAVQAESTPPPFPEFTFKRETVPTGSGKRIRVQIDPAEQARRLAPANTQPQAATSVTDTSTEGALSAHGYEWFWAEVSPKRDHGGAANLQQALAVLERQAGQGALTGPRLEDLQKIATAHGVDILKATIGTHVSPAWVLALISVESAGRADAVSSAGAQGIMQLIPATAARFGVEEPDNPEENIKGGVAYLNWLMEHFDGDPILAMAGYNAGENAVTANGGVPPFAETRAYIPKVLSAWRVARGLCMTPPDLLTDGCVFAVKGS